MSDEQRERMAGGAGFIAALDQSGGSTPKTLTAYGIDASAYSSDEEMFDLVHRMRSRIITAPSFDSRIRGTILFEDTMRREIEGRPSASYLWDVKGVVPFIKIDKGLEDQADGVQLMKPMPGLDALLAEAAGQHPIFGTKERSVVHEADERGVAAVVAQQFEVGETVLGAGLVPILEPEVSIDSATKADAEGLLLAEITAALEQVSAPVMLKLTLPETPDFYASLVGHPRVLKVVALSGGYSRDEACSRLQANHGVIASFSRALIDGLTDAMSDAEFDAALDAAVTQIAAASAT